MLALVLVGAAGLLVVVWLLYKMHYPPHFEYMDAMVRQRGELPWPIIGTVGPTETKECTKRLQDLMLDGPSPRYVKFGPQYWIMCYDAHSAEVILNDSVNLRKCLTYDFIKPWFGNGLLTSHSAEWHRQRKMLTPTFHFRILNDFVPIMNDAALVLVDKVAQRSDNGLKWNLAELTALCALDIISETSMGECLNAQRNPDGQMVKRINEFTDLVRKRIAKPWLWPDVCFWMSPTGRRMRDTINFLNDTSDGMIKRRRQQRAEGKLNAGSSCRPALLDHLLNLEEEGQLSHEQVLEQISTFVFAGHDTTSHGLLWIIYCLAHHKDIQSAVRAEINQTLGSDTQVTQEHFGRLALLDRCIKESMRLFPPIPMLARTVDKPVDLSPECHVPAGTQIVLDFFLLQSDPAHFPDPRRFDPSRFEPEKSEGRHPFAYCPFAAGPRNCLGQRFAMNELRVLLCHLVRNFEFSSEQSEKETGLVYQMVLQPSDGIWLTSTRVDGDSAAGCGGETTATDKARCYGEH